MLLSELFSIQVFSLIHYVQVILFEINCGCRQVQLNTRIVDSLNRLFLPSLCSDSMLAPTLLWWC